MRLWLKIFMTAAMTVAILVPLMMVQGVIGERQERRAEAVAGVTQNYGGWQTIAGPVLVVPYSEYVEEEVADKDGVISKTRKRRNQQWMFFPTLLEAKGPLTPDVRRRGLHEVRVYRWQGQIQAKFDAQIPDDADPGAERQIGTPWLSYQIADVRGLRDTPKLSVDGKMVEPEQGIGYREGSGLHARLQVPLSGHKMTLDTSLSLTLGGTETFSLLPLGKSNNFDISSTWPHPKFDGISPQHEIDAKGFRAQWRIASVANNVQRRFLDERVVLGVSAPSEKSDSGALIHDPDSVSVSLVDPVNPYLKAERATKYGALFVLLTFVGFFMFELIKQLPIHPIQYILVGLALAIFFLLLVSLSEHIAFGWSYLAAAAACIGLIGFYLSAVLRSLWRGVGFAAMLTTLYAALYGLLLSEDNALVLGAGLLFLVLAAIMVLTRHIDWYRITQAQR